jgi:hypothetical protein
MCHASATARKRLAAAERFIGTELPGGTGGRHPGGQHRQYHPHLHDIVPGGGRSKDRTAWRPARANCLVPVKARAPISRALCQAEMGHAGLREHIAPQGWPIPWHVHSQAKHPGHSAVTSLAPSVCNGAIANRRSVGLPDRPVTVTSRPGGRTRLRTAQLDVMEFLRRCLPHVWPAGFMKVRHCGFLHASGAGPLATIRRLMAQAPPSQDQLPPRPPPPPRLARCASGGTPRPVVLRVWTAPRDFVDTS